MNNDFLQQLQICMLTGISLVAGSLIVVLDVSSLPYFLPVSPI